MQMLVILRVAGISAAQNSVRNKPYGCGGALGGHTSGIREEKI